MNDNEKSARKRSNRPSGSGDDGQQMENSHLATKKFNSPTDTNGLSQKECRKKQLKERQQKLKHDLIETFDTTFETMFDEYTQDVDFISHDLKRDDNSFVDKLKLTTGELPEKSFIPRNSVLTELFEISHIRTIYHIFVAILIVFSINTIVFDFVDKGRIVLDFNMMIWAFGGFPHVLWMWLCMQLCTIIIVYPMFACWANTRRKGPVYWLDWMFLCAYIFYQLTFLVWPVRGMRNAQLPPASSVVITCEQTRLLMKAHAFVRENIPRALNHRKGDGKPPYPDFSKYLYFLFAPTLVYRDEYPRTTTIRWNYVCSNFAQVLACLFYIYYIFERFCVPVFQDFNSEHITARKFILSAFSSVMPGTLVLFIGFFAILHSWLNAFAEMLTFADRLFYKDWWNSSTFSNYYRTWNVVVHDWLYTYIYKDCYKLLGLSQKPLAMATVFLLSAIFHEYIICMSLGYFFPVLFIMFAGVGFALMFIPNKSDRKGNVLMWVGLFLGNGLLMCLYSMEWFARRKCPPSEDWLTELLVPKSWTCDFSAMKH